MDFPAPLKSPVNNFPITENILPIFLIALNTNLKGNTITSKTIPKTSLMFPTIESPNPALKKFKIVLNGQSITSIIPDIKEEIISGIDKNILAIPLITYPNPLNIMAGIASITFNIVLNIE